VRRKARRERNGDEGSKKETRRKKGGKRLYLDKYAKEMYSREVTGKNSLNK